MKSRERRSGSSECARVAITEIGGAEGDRTPDLRIANAALCQTELLPHAENDTTVSTFEFQVSSQRRRQEPNAGCECPSTLLRCLLSGRFWFQRADVRITQIEILAQLG